MTDTINITVNGEPMTFPATAMVADVVSVVLGADPADARGIAVALASRVVPKSAWSATPLTSGVAVELVTATQGG